MDQNKIQDTWEQERSKRLSRTLDCLGYNKDMVLFRRAACKTRETLKNRGVGDQKFTGCIVGSKAEGITKPFESDQDVLYFWPDAICIDDSCILYSSNHIFRFRLRYLNPGYCVLINENVTDTEFLCKFALNGLVSSALLKAIFERFPFKYDIHGPAASSDHSGEEIDNVCTFRCFCPSILAKWVSRPRINNWPPNYVRERILLMQGNVVPSGFDEESHLIWRLCFNEVELVISQCLNMTQIKLYKVLKLIKKDVFEIKSFKVTSYIMKNIVFWLAETFPQTDFRPDNLFTWVIKALRFLKRSVAKNYIPYYMIPGRNLLAEKIDERSRSYLQKEISRLIQRGSYLLLECNIIRSVISVTPEEQEMNRKQYDLIEKLYESKRIREMYLRSLGLQHEEIQKDQIYRAIFGLLLQLVNKELIEAQMRRAAQLGRLPNYIDLIVNL